MLCQHCGLPVEEIRNRWVHIIDLPHGEEHYLWCRVSKAEPVGDTES